MRMLKYLAQYFTSCLCETVFNSSISSSTVMSRVLNEQRTRYECLKSIGFDWVEK